MAKTNAKYLILGNGFDASAAGELIAKLKAAGGITVDTDGFQIASESIVNAMIAADAAIATSKLADGSLFVKSNGSVPMIANLNMSPDAGTTRYKVVNLADGTEDYDAVNKSQMDSAIAAAVSANSVDELVVSVASVAHGFDGDFVYHNGTTWVKAQANAETSAATHFARRAAVDGDDNFELIQVGEVAISSLLDDASGALVAGQYYFLSGTVAGKVTTTEPASGISQLVLKANSASSGTVFCHQPVVVDEASATWGDIDGTITDQTDLMNLFDAVAGGHAAFDFSALESVGDTTSTLSGAIGDLDDDLKALSDAVGVSLGATDVAFSGLEYIADGSKTVKAAIEEMDGAIASAVQSLVTGTSFNVVIHSETRYADAAAAVAGGLEAGEKFMLSGSLAVHEITNDTGGSEASVLITNLVAGNVIPILDGSTGAPSSEMYLVIEGADGNTPDVVKVQWELTAAGDELKMDSTDGRTLHVDVSYTPTNWDAPTGSGSDGNVLVADHLAEIDAKIGEIVGASALAKTEDFHLITAGEVSAGFFELSAAVAAGFTSVRLFPIDGIEQFNKVRGEVVTLGATPDFEVDNSGTGGVGRVHFKNVATSGLSEILAEGDKVRVEFLEA